MTLFYNDKLRQARSHFAEIGQDGKYKMTEALDFVQKCDTHMESGTVPVCEELSFKND